MYNYFNLLFKESFFHRFDLLLSKRSELIVTTCLIIFFASLGVYFRFIQDDAFISFRYAENLVEYGELTWNPGESPKVEGYTNFLWTLIIAFFISLGLDPIILSFSLGIFFGIGTLTSLYAASKKITESRTVALSTIILLGTNFTYLVYNTGGLETQLQMCLVTICFWISVDDINPKRLFAFSIIGGLAFLTRMDSFILIAPMTIYLLCRVHRHTDNAEMSKAISFLIIPGALIVSTWLFWKMTYYGEILPNTYYAKATGDTLMRMRVGMIYLFMFYYSYLLFPYLLLLFASLPWFIRRKQVWYTLLLYILWNIYVIRVGGDFMEFRFVLLSLPFLFILLSMAIRQIRISILQLALILGVTAGSVYHSNYFMNEIHGWKFTAIGIEKPFDMNATLTQPSTQWINIGKKLRETFQPRHNDVLVASLPVGAIGYYSKMPIIDMLGLNDRWVARNGAHLGIRPGHSRIATIGYLLERRVNLVIGHPVVTHRNERLPHLVNFFGSPGYRSPDVPEQSTLIKMPLNQDQVVHLVYMVQHDYVDEQIKKLKLETYVIEGYGID